MSKKMQQKGEEEVKIRFRLDDNGNIQPHRKNVETKKRKGVTSERDCKVKQEVLGYLLKFPDGLTAREIFDSGCYSGSYDNLRSHLTKYCRGGKKTKDGRMGDNKYVYLYKVGKKPARYCLTDFGRINAENPFLNREEAKRVYMRKMEVTLGTFLNEQPNTLTELVNQLTGMNIGGGTGGRGSDSNGCSDGTSNNDFGGLKDNHNQTSDGTEPENDTEELRGMIDELKCDEKFKKFLKRLPDMQPYELSEESKGLDRNQLFKVMMELKNLYDTKKKTIVYKEYGGRQQSSGNSGKTQKKTNKPKNSGRVYDSRIKNFENKLVTYDGYFKGKDGVPFRLMRALVSTPNMRKMKNKVLGNDTPNVSKGEIFIVPKNSVKKFDGMGFAEELTDKDFVRLQIHERIDKNGNVFVQSYVNQKHWYVTSSSEYIK